VPQQAVAVAEPEDSEPQAVEEAEETPKPKRRSRAKKEDAK